MQKHDVVVFLQSYKIKPTYFVQEYGSRVIYMEENYFPNNQYLVTKEALFHFQDKDINPHAIFCLYQSLKDVSIELIEEGDILSSPMMLNRDRIIIET